MLHKVLEQRLHQAVLAVVADSGSADILVRPCADPRFGDYQSNAVMALAKARRLNPRQLATEIIAKLDVGEWCERVEIAGAGFINFRLAPTAFAKAIQAAHSGAHLFFEPTQSPRTIVVDFSSPNVAKPMHVGHIRSTVLGDCLTRVMRLLGHRVITDNHIGDWGTQFGKLLVGWKRELDRAALDLDPIGEMERLYKRVHAECESDPAALDSARRELVKLQDGDPENLAIWGEMIALSQRQFDSIYSRLGVKFDHTLGESFYNDRLRTVVEELRERGIARESEGAAVVFFDEDPELKAHPALIRKSDGAANYATTDLATLQYRLQNWHPDEIVYVTDGRQQLHFKQLFAVFRKWQPEAVVKLAHVWFGSILGEDGRPFKTRSGETVRLAELLDEAEERAFRVVSEKNSELDEAERREVARMVGIGAVKYADLLPNRQSDYVFSWDKMLALQGNTAPYLQYAVARIQSIFRKASETEPSSDGEMVLTSPEEINLARHLMNFGLVLELVVADYRPNHLCNYLYELAGHFAGFYENCPVIKASGAIKKTRLALCNVTGRVMKIGLEALGIETPERM